jgi:HemY protein
MKPYRSLLLLLALAMLGALAWHLLAADPGYLLLTLYGWSIETTVVVAAAGLLALLITLRLLFGLLRAPWRLWRRGRRRIARERLAGGLLALHRGQWARAEKLLQRAAAERDLRLPALLAASQAARERSADARAEALLAEVGRHGGDIDAALPVVERLLAEQRAGTACELLESCARQGALPPRALELQARALAGCGRAEQAVALLPELRRQQVREGDALRQLETTLLRAWLLDAEQPGTLQQRWKSLDRGQRLRPTLVEAYAEQAVRHGDPDAAAEAIERTQAKCWSDRLARRYGSLPHSRPGAALKTAERWLAEHPDAPSVLLCLGRLCRHDQLWGKAEAYLERAISLGAGAEAWEALAEVSLDQHDEPRARQAYANALAAGRDEPVRPVLRLQRGGGEAAVAEERSSMGVPRLPAA